MIKRILFCLIACIFSCNISVFADSFSVYDGNMSSNALSYFRDIEIPFFYDYVVWRDSDYSYKMFVSDSLEKSNNVYTADSGVLYNWYTSGNYNNVQHFSTSELNSFSLSNSSHLIVYSSIGNAARLERGLDYEKVLLFTLFTACIFVLIGILFKSVKVTPFGSSKR